MRLLAAALLLASAAPLSAQTMDPSEFPIPAPSTPTAAGPSFAAPHERVKLPSWDGMQTAAGRLLTDFGGGTSAPYGAVAAPASLGALFDGTASLHAPVPVITAPNKKLDGPWTYRFSFGPSRTQYFNTDLHIKTSKVRGTFYGVGLRERTSMEYYEVWKQKNPFNFIDEPTNTMVFSAENTRKKYALNLVVFHPKFLIAGDGLNTDVHFKGEVEGEPVDERVDLNETFGQYQLTKGQLDVQGQFQKIIPIVESRKAGSLQYRPGAGVGVIIGSPYATYINKKKESKEYKGTLAPTGASVSLSNSLTYVFPRDRLSLSFAHDFTAGFMRYTILDGKAVQELVYQNFNVSAGWRLHKGKKR